MPAEVVCAECWKEGLGARLVGGVLHPYRHRTPDGRAWCTGHRRAGVPGALSTAFNGFLCAPRGPAGMPALHRFERAITDALDAARAEGFAAGRLDRGGA